MSTAWPSTAREGDGPLRDEGHGEALRALAAAVAGRELVAPAVFLLQVARPLHLLLQQALFVAHPLLQPWFDDRLLLWADLLEDSEALERAICQVSRVPGAGL
jgi:hypothetical protein